MRNKAYKTLKLLRPKQWIKNLAIFAPIIFTGQLFNIPVLLNVLLGFVVFCGVSSGIYIINDIFDIHKDRQHPFKRFRPLAHGDLPIVFAIILFVITTVASLFLATFVTPLFIAVVLVYLFLQLSYSIVLKNIAVIDILALAAGYMLRVYAGEFASGGYHISVWLLLTTIALSLFLAIGKRKSELTLISHMPEAALEATRKTLSHYSNKLLDVYASIFATATFVFYSLFTFLESANYSKVSLSILMPNFLPTYFQRKWLMITIVPVVYGLMRYLQDIYEKHEGESPEKVLLSDVPLLTTVMIWLLLVIAIIYFL